MTYDFVEVNNFIVANASDEYYEADFKLYRKLFPESRILKDLENPFPPKKKELDERMLFEILNAERVCFETIMENRGIIVDSAKDKGNKISADTETYVKQLLEADLETLKYNELKPLVFGLKLTVSDQKTETLKAALREFKETLLKAANDGEANGSATTDDEANNASATDVQPMTNDDAVNDGLSPAVPANDSAATEEKKS